MTCRSDNFSVFVEGAPIPQGSKRAFVRNGRISIVEANPKLKAWRSTILDAVFEALDSTADQCHHAVEVQLLFIMPRPKTVTRIHPTVPPDVDKLTRAVLDGITDSGLWADDSQVVGVLARKGYEHSAVKPGVQIFIRHAENII